MPKINKYKDNSKLISQVTHFTCQDVNGNLVNIPISEIPELEDVLANTTAISELQDELDNTQIGSGLGSDGTYNANAGANYISGATSLNGADVLLDAQIKANADDIGNLDLEDVRQNNNSIAGDINFGGNAANNVSEIGFNGGQSVSWNDTFKTLDVPTGFGPVLQVGQEIYFILYNNTGSIVPNGTVVKPTGAVSIADPLFTHATKI